MAADDRPVAQLRHIANQGELYDALVVWCPGCEYVDRHGEVVAGLHMLPVNSGHSPSWGWNGSLSAPTLEPSILSRTSRPQQGWDDFVCHSYLRNGVWEFLGDCTHVLVNQHVPMVPLPGWVVRDG